VWGEGRRDGLGEACNATAGLESPSHPNAHPCACGCSGGRDERGGCDDDQPALPGCDAFRSGSRVLGQPAGPPPHPPPPEPAPLDPGPPPGEKEKASGLRLCIESVGVAWGEEARAAG
jgi:hypothetical protein